MVWNPSIRMLLELKLKLNTLYGLLTLANETMTKLTLKIENCLVHSNS